MNKIDKKTIALGLLALGVTIVPLTGAFIYKNMNNTNNLKTEEVAQKNEVETKEEVKNSEEVKEEQTKETQEIEQPQETNDKKGERASPSDSNNKERKTRKPTRKGEVIDSKINETTNS